MTTGKVLDWIRSTTSGYDWETGSDSEIEAAINSKSYISESLSKFLDGRYDQVRDHLGNQIVSAIADRISETTSERELDNLAGRIHPAFRNDSEIQGAIQERSEIYEQTQAVEEISRKKTVYTLREYESQLSAEERASPKVQQALEEQRQAILPDPDVLFAKVERARTSAALYDLVEQMTEAEIPQSQIITAVNSRAEELGINPILL